MDTVPTTVRSQIMRRVQSEDTRPEMAVRRLTFSMGFRYRLHDVLMATSESAIVAGECQPHRQCRMAASGPQGRSPERAGGHGASFWDNWFQGKPMPLPRRWRREKKRMSREGPRRGDQAFEIELIFG